MRPRLPSFTLPSARILLPIAAVLVILCSVAKTALAAAHPAPVQPPHALVPVVTTVPRTVIGFYDSRTEGEWWKTTFHQHLEMPFNHLGLVIEPHDISQPWPDLSKRDDVRGIMLWFHGETIDDPVAFIHWAIASLGKDRSLGVIGTSALTTDSKGREVPMDEVNQLLALAGAQLLQDQINVTYPWDLARADPAYFGFERPLPKALPTFHRAAATKDGTSLLSLADRQMSSTADLATLGPRGAYLVSDDYAFLEVEELDRIQWILNPFNFVSNAFATDAMPKPDYTTLDGNRIYFSHIDGDGWRNGSLVPTAAGQEQRAVDVLYNQVFKAYPDLPFTVAPVAADLDQAWCGDAQSQQVARNIFALPNTELASHTYSHPLIWQFFSDYSTEKEKPYLSQYPPCIEVTDSRGLIGQTLDKLLGRQIRTENQGGTEGDTDNPNGTPRSYDQHTFDLNHEIVDARTYLQSYAPPNKKLTLLQWSGDTTPYPAAIAAVNEASLLNLNGGDTRFDDEYNSNAWVAPVGRFTPAGWQIYAAASNENTYTDHWTDRYYGLRYLVQTYRNTETPRRLNPINLYFHIFVADRPAGVAGLREALDWISKQPITPVNTSQYARIANGFYSTKLLQTGPASWRVTDRGALQTIRFRAQAGMDVDYAASSGVVGASKADDNLYVALDPDTPEPVIALSATAAMPAFGLVQSRWPVHAVTQTAAGVSFHAAGFGPGDMTWRVALPGAYEVSVQDGSAIQVLPSVQAEDGLLHLALPRSSAENLTVTIRRAA